MAIAASLPQSTLDIKGDRLRFLLALAVSECENQFRIGLGDKATNTIALLNATTALLTPLTTPGSITISAISTDDRITAAEAASNISITGTTALANGQTVQLYVDGVPYNTAVVAANAYTITFTAAQATALALGDHTFSVKVTDTAGYTRFAERRVVRAP